MPYNWPVLPICPFIIHVYLCIVLFMQWCSIGPGCAVLVPDVSIGPGCAVLVLWICSIGPPDVQYWSSGYAVLVHWICSIGPMDMSKIKPECFRLPKNTYLSKVRPNVIIRGHICAFCEVFVLSQCLTVRVSELLTLNMSY